MRYFYLFLTLVGFVTIHGGCTQMFAEHMVEAPNKYGFKAAPGDVTTHAAPSSPGTKQKLLIPVGPPDATLAVWVLEPVEQPPRGTIILLHGIIATHNGVRPTAQRLQKAGYRTVMIDLRGHGQSSGEHVTFGIVESRDVSQAITFLQKYKLCGDTVGVYGVSLGAATAIQLAAIDPRVRAVVAVSPFANLRTEVKSFAQTVLPLPGLFLSDTDYKNIVDSAGKIANFDPDLASPLVAIQKTKIPILLVHGAVDLITTASESQLLHAAAPQTTQLKIFPAHGHLTLAFNLSAEVPKITRQWFDQHLGASTTSVAVAAQLTPEENPAHSAPHSPAKSPHPPASD